MSAYDRLTRLLKQLLDTAYYRGVKNQPAPTDDDARQAADQVVHVAMEAIRNG